MKAFTMTAFAGAALATPFSFPLANGFPQLSQQALAEVQKQAGGTLPNTPLPTQLTKDVETSLQLVAANELFEVAYFTELYHNITTNVPGYECTEEDRTFVEKAIFRIRAQEELHATGANAILKTNGAQTVGPCKYNFPVSDFASAIKLANTFTDVVLGVLPVVQLQAATDGGPNGAGLVPLFGSIEEQEAQQTGWFRVLQGKFPSAAPFLSATTPEFALSAVKMFLVPGSCPPEYAAVEAAVNSFPPLTVATAPTATAQTAAYQVTGHINPQTDAIAYISGQNKPVVVAITNVQRHGDATTFDAEFPADKDGFADGLTIAAVVKKGTDFQNPAQVAEATLFGPGLIEYN